MSEQWNEPKAQGRAKQLEPGHRRHLHRYEMSPSVYSAEINYSTLGSHSRKELKYFPPHLQGCSPLKTRAAALMPSPIWQWRWGRERSARKFPNMVWDRSEKNEGSAKQGH